MTREEICQTVIRLVSKRIRDKRLLPKITETSHLELDLGIDSLNRVELASDILDTFSLEVSYEEMQDILTVGKVIDFVARHTLVTT